MKISKKDIVIGLSFLAAIAGLVVVNSPLRERIIDRGSLPAAASRDSDAAPSSQSVERIPGIPGKTRTTRFALDRTGYTNARVESGKEEEIYSIPLNADVEHVPAKDAPLEEGDLVMGVVIAGEARAYPVNYMMGPYNEVVNDTVGGMPLAATW